MKQRLLYAMLGTMVLAACSDEVAVDKDLPSSPGVIVAAPPVQPAGCSFRDARAFARDYFLGNTNRQAATSALSAAEGFAVGTQQRTDALFTVLGLVASVAGDPSKAANPGTGPALVNEVVECGPLTVTDNRSFFPVVLTSALTDGQGGFATPTGTVTVQAENGGIAIAPNAGNSWDIGVGQVAVFIGVLASTSLPHVEGTTPYRIGLIYGGTQTPVVGDDHFSVEFCNVTTVPAASLGGVGRSRGSGSNTILQIGAAVCNTPTPGSVIGQMLDRVIGFFTPAALQASMLAPPPWSGSTGGLESDFAVVEASAVHVDAPLEPSGIANAVVGDTNHYALNVVADFAGPPAAAGVPVEGVDFHFAVSGNQGQPVQLSGPGCLGTSCTVTTDESGNATLSVAFLKPGGYTIVLTVSFGTLVLETRTYTNIQITGN